MASKLTITSQLSRGEAEEKTWVPVIKSHLRAFSTRLRSQRLPWYTLLLKNAEEAARGSNQLFSFSFPIRATSVYLFVLLGLSSLSLSLFKAEVYFCIELLLFWRLIVWLPLALFSNTLISRIRRCWSCFCLSNSIRSAPSERLLDCKFYRKWLKFFKSLLACLWGNLKLTGVHILPIPSE